MVRTTHTQDRHGGTGTRRRRWRDNDGRELAINVFLSSVFCEGSCAMLPSYFLAHVLFLLWWTFAISSWQSPRSN